MIETYRNLENSFSIEISKTKNYSAFLSISRLGSFFIIVAFIAAFSSSGNAFYILLSLLSLILFGFLIYKHHKTVEKLNVLEKKLKYIQTEIDIKKNKLDKLETGREFLDEEHPYCKDLDMFGENSFYQYIRRTTTMLGKQRLAHYLLNPLNSKEKIEQRQESIKELKEMLDWRIDFNLNSFEKPFDYSKLNKIFTWLDDKKLLFDNKFIVFLTYLLPVINIGLLVVCSLTSMPWTLFWVFVLGQSLFFIKQIKIKRQLMSILTDTLNEISEIARLLKQIENTDYKSLELNQLKSSIAGTYDSIRALKKINDLLDSSQNFIAQIFLNFLLLNDIRLCADLEKWKLQNKDKIRKSFDVIAEFEVISSFASFAYNNDDFNFPKITKEFSLNAKNITHPLILPEDRIGNDFQISTMDSYYIVTGANMSGKSTFLRTIAVNLILAQNGLPVCADSFECSPIAIFSCMRYSDSISKKSSYFYSEVLRLKQLVDMLETGSETFFIIDEIFNGTNSNDKTLASIKFLEKVITYKNSVGILATHDLSLTVFEEKYPQNFTNLCFEIKNVKDKISYDYKIQRGITSSNNALILLKEVGIV